MFGFGKKNKATKMPDEPAAYTMTVIANMTKLDPTKFPNNLRDEMTMGAIKAAEDPKNKYDFCANYMLRFATVLHGVGKAQNEAGWEEKSGRVLEALDNFIEFEKDHIPKPTYDMIRHYLDGSAN